MVIKAIQFILSLLFFLSFVSDSFAHKVICVHFNEKEVHLEVGHPDFPFVSDEVHLELSPDITFKVSKITPDLFSPAIYNLQPGIQFSGASFGYGLQSQTLKVKESHLRTIRLLI